MKERRKPITETEARRNLQALEILNRNYTGAGMKPPKKHNQNESEMQQVLFEWAKWNVGKYPELKLLHSIPNGGKRDIVTGARLKREGALAGVSDIHLPVPKGQYHSLWLELKVGSNKPTDKQKWFIDEMTKQGSKACVAYSLDEAIKVIEDYLKLNAGEK